jgi:hypothetical protein
MIVGCTINISIISFKMHIILYPDCCHGDYLSMLASCFIVYCLLPWLLFEYVVIFSCIFISTKQ